MYIWTGNLVNWNPERNETTNNVISTF